MAFRTRIVAIMGAFLFSSPLFAQQPPERPISADLLALMARQGEATYLVVLRERADLSAAAAASDRQAQGRFVFQALKSVAEVSQRPLRDFLTAEQAAGRARNVRSFFSVNAIGVTSGEATLRRLAAFPQVDEILEAPVLEIPQPIPGVPQPSIQNVEWNIAQIHAPAVWARGFTGQGIVVANIDTGVQFDHPALVNRYRGKLPGGTFSHDYNWWDATGACLLAPCDNNEHGTHTMGIMVGSDGANQIGAAPGATWIACKALSASGAGNLFDLLECGDWILAPWNLQGRNPNPDRRPHIVNNSWGYAFGGLSVFRTMVANWRAAGIFPAFVAGNAGPACGTATSPGDYPESFATGAAGMNDVIAYFSSRGPSLFAGTVKPDVTAPGVNVRSSVPPSSYAVFSGTSMASPHTAAIVALLWSEYPNLVRDIANTEKQLRPAAEILNSTEMCGGNGPTQHPNNTFGSGRVDAVQTQKPFPVYTNRSVYHAGDQFTLKVSLLNPSSTTWTVDTYLGFRLPSLATALFPLGTAVLPPSLKLFDIGLISGVLSGTEATGAYEGFTLFVQPGTDPSNPANHISEDMAPFTIQ